LRAHGLELAFLHHAYRTQAACRYAKRDTKQYAKLRKKATGYAVADHGEFVLLLHGKVNTDWCSITASNGEPCRFLDESNGNMPVCFTDAMLA
jgi:uncharacterized protein YcsI (UPF0317 family)